MESGSNAADKAVEKLVLEPIIERLKPYGLRSHPILTEQNEVLAEVAKKPPLGALDGVIGGNLTLELRVLA
jgi:hypothetical protein